jgi:hypothetical protein
MSEPDAAFLKLQISRESLIRWLDSPVPPASNWRDWCDWRRDYTAALNRLVELRTTNRRDIGEQWRFEDGPPPIADISDAKLQENIAQCDERLVQRTNRQVLRDVLERAEAPFLKHAAYDEKTREFVAGSLTYSENLLDFIVFLTLARGATDYLEPGGCGVAVIHQYLWGDENDRITQAAMRLGPAGKSEFMVKAEKKSAPGAFQPLADGMLVGTPADARR